METINKQAILDVLNSLDVIEQCGSEGYILVANNVENHKKLNALGVPSESINKYGDAETFCIISLALSEGYANECLYGVLVNLPYTEPKEPVSYLKNLLEDIKNAAFNENDSPVNVDLTDILNLSNVLDEYTRLKKERDIYKDEADSWKLPD